MAEVENNTVENENKVEEDPYAYLDRGQFSSENFKVEIKNLPKFYGVSEFKKLLNEKLKLNSNKIKIPRRNCSYAFACFRNDEDRDKAIIEITGCMWKGKKLEATKAKPAPDPLVKKRKEDADEDRSNKKVKTDNRSQEEKLKYSTIPYWNVEYEEQLKLKENDIKQVLRRLANYLDRKNPEIRRWLHKQRALYKGLPCELLEIRHADTIDGYRNKCEFSVGINEETGLSTVGFRMGAYVNGITGVGPVENLRHIPDSMKLSVKLFQNFVRNSDLQVFNPEYHTGHFRQLCVRTAPNQIMLVVGIHPQDLSQEKLQEFKNSLVEYFTNGEGKELNVTSLYYQAIVKKTHKEDAIAPEHLHGDTHIYETILGLKFKISPEAFLQINTAAAEILYSAAIELAAPTDKSTVIDVCCGTGTIGLCFANKCDQVLGLEIVPQAILDAKENAVANGIENSDFFAGKAEEIVGDVCFKSKNDDIIAVVDPPRAGLHNDAIKKLRNMRKINKLIYVSCKPETAIKNFEDLCRPESKTLHGDMYVPVKAVAVDLFPHTKHCELVISFERWGIVSKRFEEQEESLKETKEEKPNSQDNL